MAAYKARISEFESVLKEDVICLKTLQRLANEGCPHEKSIRAKTWKVLLNYLPLKTAEWTSHLAKQRRSYKHFIDEIIIQPGQQKYDSNRVDVTNADHPLNLEPDSTWSQFFQDNEMLMQIDKDCRRLCPDLFFFSSATLYPCKELVDPKSDVETLRKRVERCGLKTQNVARNRMGITVTDKIRRPRTQSMDYVALPEGEEAHWEVAERILFIYGKLNPGQGYVQGMNEIIGPIYYTFASDLDADSQENAEADAFWCFTNLMSEIRDNFIKTLDDSACGIGMLMNHMMKTLKEVDTALFLKLDQQDLKPQYYAFRWLTLLLSQEFPLPDVIRLWDSLLSDENRFDFLIYVAVAMLVLVRDELLTGDFPHNMKLVQNYPATDVLKILAKASDLSKRR